MKRTKKYLTLRRVVGLILLPVVVPVGMLLAMALFLVLESGAMADTIGDTAISLVTRNKAA